MSEKGSFGQPAGHQLRHRQQDPGFLRRGEFFVVLAQATVPSQPGEGPFHHSAPGEHLEAGRRGGRFLIDRYPDPLPWALHHRPRHAQGLLSPGDQRAPVAGVQPYLGPLRKDRAKRRQHASCAIPIRHVRRMDHRPQHQSARIDQQMALAAAQFLGAIPAPWPPFSVVRTDWLSRIAAVGKADRPARCRTCPRNVALARAQVPSHRHCRK